MILSLALATAAGAMIPLGGWLATREGIQPRWLAEELRHSVIAFGGGALLSAVALVLVPDGAARLPAWAAVAFFAAGGAAFAAIDRAIERRGGPGGQMVAMLTDFLPEAAALGALLATGATAKGVLTAAIMAAQNLPEAFNAWREMAADGPMPRGRLLQFAGLALLGPAAALFGELVLADHQAALGALMVFAGGGILYLVFQDVAPGVRLRAAWAPPLGAVAGFGLGLAGHLAIGG